MIADRTVRGPSQKVAAGRPAAGRIGRRPEPVAPDARAGSRSSDRHNARPRVFAIARNKREDLVRWQQVAIP